MDLSPIVDTAATLASAVFAACAPVVVLKLNTMLKLNLDQTHRAAVSTALDNALGVGLQLAKEAGDAQLGNVNVRSAALAAMVGYVKQAVPAAVTHFDLTDDSLAQKAAARLASALHASSSTPAAASATSAVTSSAIAPAPAMAASPLPAGS
jgi:hypothetical protein